MVFASLREAPTVSPVVVVFVFEQVYVPASVIEISALPQAVIERSSAAARNDALAGPAANAHLALPALSVAQRTADVSIFSAEIAPAANNAAVVAAANSTSGPGPNATVVNVPPPATLVTQGSAMLLTPGSTGNVERAGGSLADDETGAQTAPGVQPNAQQTAPAQERAPSVSSAIVQDPKVVTVEPNQVVERSPLLATVQVEIESFERALDAALGEIGEMGEDFVGWIEDNVGWNSAAAATVAASAGGAYALRRRMRRAAEQEDEELSSTWLFTSFQTPSGHA
jgi:hypothetical protein